MAQTFILKKVPLWPVIRMGFVLFIIIGILIGIFYALLLSSWSFFASSFGDSSLVNPFGMLRNLGFILIPVVAILYAVIGTIVVAIWVLIYNVMASIVGGVELMLEAAEKVARPASPHMIAPDGSAHVPSDKTITGF
jgi:hypothetical protein